VNRTVSCCWIVAVLALSAPAAAYAQQPYGDPANYPGTFLTQRTTPVGSGAFSIDVTYFITPGSFSNVEVNLIRAAAATWSNQSLTGAQVRLVEVTSAAGAGMVVTSANLNDLNTNLAQTALTTVPGAGTYPDGSPWRQITSATITIDSDPPGAPGYFTGAGNVPAGRYDFLSLILREFGVGLGIGFATGANPNSVMDANLALGEQHRALTLGDTLALQAVYQSRPPGRLRQPRARDLGSVRHRPRRPCRTAPVQAKMSPWETGSSKISPITSACDLT
jgi:hypothetical protein